MAASEASRVKIVQQGLTDWGGGEGCEPRTVLWELLNGYGNTLCTLLPTHPPPPSPTRAVRERYKNLLDPSLNTAPFTAVEDRQLFALHQEYGSKWVKISKIMSDRSENSLKNRWNSKAFQKSQAAWK